MNFNGINQVQSSAIQTKKGITKAVEKQAPQESEVTKEKSDAGCLKNYFLGGKVAFGGFPCSTANFAVKKLKDVPCCCCGKPMLRNEDVAKCHREVSNSSGEKLANKLNEYSRYMRADEKVVGTILANEAKETGCGLSQAMKNTSGNLYELTSDYVGGVLSELKGVAQEKFHSEENPVAHLIDKSSKGIEKGTGLDRMQFLESLEKAYSKLGEGDKAELQDVAMNLPQSFNHVEKIYGKYLTRKDGDIARRLFSTAMTTAEHIHPHSLGGANHTSNYIAECAGCNNPRGSMPYSEWLKVHPEYPRKAQEHIEHVQARIINGEIGSNYNDYPVDVRASLSKESGGRMVLKVLNPQTIERMRENRSQTGKVDVQDVQEALELLEAEKSDKAENEKDNKTNHNHNHRKHR